MDERRDLNVVQVVGSFGGGGAQRVAFNLIVALADRGIRSRGIAVRFAGDFAESSADVEVVELHAERGGRLGQFRAMFRLRRLLRRWGVDAVHVHGSNCLPFVMLAIQGMSRRPVVVFTWHDSQSVFEGRSGFARKLLVWALRRCDRVSGSSSSVVARLAKGAGLSRVEVFHGGVPVRPASHPDPQAPPLVLWMGRFVPQKDPAALIRAAARLKASGLRFSVCMIGRAHGESTYDDDMRRLVGELHVEDVVQFPGYLDQPHVDALLRQASIGVQTSLTEGLSMAVLEQMMAGLAVVATDVGDTHDVIVDRETGLLIPAADDDALTASIGRLLADPGLRSTLGQAARRHALGVASLDAMARRAVEAYASGGR